MSNALAPARKGIPLVADRNAFAAQSHTSLYRMLFCTLLSKAEHRPAEDILHEYWPDDTTASILIRAR